jgi:8-oxo-dGTP diphosphatase
MEISDFKLGEKYKREDLMSAFKGAFQGGINICKRTNTIVITSKHTGNRIYDDKLFDGDVMYYTGEGQVGDQKMWKGNKAILEAKEKGRDIHLFVRFKPTEYTYFGIVELVDQPYYADEKDTEGTIRKVIKFPMMQSTSIRRLTEYEMRNIVAGGITPMEKPVIQVVGAAIINEKGELLCAQRGYGSLIGKWEFPGGKVEKGETDQQALAREIKEELDIDVEVEELIDENYNEYSDKNINLKVYRCKYVSGAINDTEHQALAWKKPDAVESLDWAEADKPIVDTYLDTLPKRIDGEPLQFDYFEAEAVKPSNKELVRAVQDYEKSQRNKQKAGENAEVAVIHYERDKLNNLGHPELAELVTQVSKDNSAAGYDVKSYEINDDGSFVEIHIEVKSAKIVGKYVEFFVSENELNKFKSDANHKIYCLIKSGRSYKLHEVNKYDFFRNNYLSPMTYRVRIRVAE